MKKRMDGRAPDQLRPVRLLPDFTENPLASVLCEFGGTKVLCTVCLEESVPRFLVGQGKGWVTAEYSLLPGSTDRRTEREVSRGKASGRTLEIQRLIGRSLRSVTEMAQMGPHTVTVDCDVLQADGGTRTASITGAWVALSLACDWMMHEGLVERGPVLENVAAVSVGLVNGIPCLDLDYREDSSAQVDMNVVGTGSGGLVEVQGTAEGDPFQRHELDILLDLAMSGIEGLVAAQSRALESS